MFGGVDLATLKDKDKDEIATLTATSYVAFGVADARNETHVVDFEGCLKSYL